MRQRARCLDMDKFKPISGSEKVIQIGIGLLVALIFAIGLVFVAPFLFQWIAVFFDPSAEGLQDCNIQDFRKKTLSEYQACKAQSQSYASKVGRLSHQIPWFWIAFIFFGWRMLRNPLKGRIRDDSHDIVYSGQGAWDSVLLLIMQPMIIVCLWAFLVRDKTPFIALGIGVAVIVFWFLINAWLLKNYGKPRSESGCP